MLRLFCIIVLLLMSYSYAEQSVEQKINNLTDSLLNKNSIDQSKELAVFPLTVNGISNTSQDLGTGLSEMIVSRISVSNTFKLVDRSSLQKVLEEIALTQTGLMSDEQIIESGNFASADYIITGTISSVMGQYVVVVKLVETKSSQIISTAKTTLNITATSELLEDLLSEKKYVVNSLFRSMLIPGWGQVFSNKPSHGIVSGVLCAGGIVATVITGVSRSSAWDDYNSYSRYLKTPSEYQPDQQQYMDDNGVDAVTANEYFYGIKDDKYSEYNRKHTGFVIALSATSGLWVLNLVDAAITGKKEQGRVKLYYSALPGYYGELKIAFSF